MLVVVGQRTTNKSIIGGGGIENIEDVKDYLKNGVDFVKLASCFYDVSSDSLNINKID